MSIRLNNSADNLSIAQAPNPALFTCVLSCKLSTDRNTFSCPISFQDGSTNYMYMETDLDGTTMKWWAWTGAVITSGPNMAVGDWYNFACQRNGNSIYSLKYKRIVDQTMNTSTNTGTATMSINTVQIGNSPFAGENFDGCVAGVKIWEDVLSDAEISNEWRQIAPIRTRNLWAFYPLVGNLGPVGPIAAGVDWSGNGRHLTIAGTVDTGDNNPPIPWRVGQRPSSISHH